MLVGYGAVVVKEGRLRRQYIVGEGNSNIRAMTRSLYYGIGADLHMHKVVFALVVSM